ncbi:MAG: SDR family oxidoreductase [Christensenellaceae bacterium]|nr:SDR family oxidoreductase [Christensenellaceae bacterium]
MELKGKTAIVTGAAQGIGYESAALMAKRGANVVISDINKAGSEAAAAKIGENACAFAGDISDLEYHKKLVEFTIEKFGRIDILVNNAGISGQIDILDITPEAYDKVHSINLRGATFLSSLVMRHMTENKYGRIVNIASLAGERGGLYAGVHYSTSKAGVIVLTKCLALKGGAYGITANAVAPGLIDTALAGLFTEDSVKEIPMKRFGTPAEVAEAVAFLASDRASYISGCTIDVNGGQFMR